MDCLYGQGRTIQPFRSNKGIQLQWTGDKSNLVELAYAIYGTKQLNNGDADIIDIVEWLEQTLQISLGRYYQTFADIRMRKAVSKTRYLDHLRDMLR